MTYLKSIFIKLSPVFLTLFLAACGGASSGSSSDYQAPKKEINTDLGNVIGNPVTKQGYDGSGSERKVSISVTVTPYAKGFKVLFEPVSKHSICNWKSIIQGGKQVSLGLIATSLSSFRQQSFYKGYIVYGANTACDDYQVTTEWAIFSDRIGINPNQPYSVQFGSRVEDKKGKEQVFEINPQ